MKLPDCRMGEKDAAVRPSRQPPEGTSHTLNAHPGGGGGELDQLITLRYSGAAAPMTGV